MNLISEYIEKSASVSWWRKTFPFLPWIIHNKKIRQITICWRDCSYYAKHVGKSHLLDLLIENHPSPGHKAKLVGIQIWY
jgi:hypothetical protein